MLHVQTQNTIEWLFATETSFIGENAKREIENYHSWLTGGRVVAMRYFDCIFVSTELKNGKVEYWRDAKVVYCLVDGQWVLS